LLNDLSHMIDLLEDMKEKLRFVIDCLSNPTNNKIQIIKGSTEPNPEVGEIFKYFIHKILLSYKDKYIKTTLDSHIKDLSQKFVTLVEQIEISIKKFIEYGDSVHQNIGKLNKDPVVNDSYIYGLPRRIMRDLVKNIATNIDDMDYKIMVCFSKLMDIYFLRRFLDKDYITNAIVYTGAAHSVNYINILVKTFDFKVTHASYSKISSMDELNAKIKSSDITEELFYPTEFNQCSDVTNFPKDFL
jgi:uncharacterized protein DUF5847